jgi:hypothetical protein
MMVVERYDEYAHRGMINAWCDAHGLNRFPYGWLPSAGFIVDQMAAMWIYTTDSDVSFLENVISNADADPAQRNVALDLIVDRCILYAREHGASYLVGASRFTAILARAAKHGFKVLPPSQQIVKELVYV